MGQRGPKPKHPALKLLAGNPGKRTVAGTSPRVSGRARRGRPDKPRELTGEAAKEWDRIIPELEAAGWLAVVDRAGLAAYCLAWAQMVWADEVCREEGAVIREPVQTAKGEVTEFVRLKAHPAVKIHTEASRRVLSFLAEFGLTPAARGRLEGDAPAEAPTGNRVVGIRDHIKAIRDDESGKR